MTHFFLFFVLKPQTYPNYQLKMKKIPFGEARPQGPKNTPQKQGFSALLPLDFGHLNCYIVVLMRGPKGQNGTPKVPISRVPRVPGGPFQFQYYKKGPKKGAAPAPLQCDFGHPNFGSRVPWDRPTNPTIKHQNLRKTSEWIC